MRARLIAGRLFGQQRCETNSFVAEFLSNQAFAAGRLVAFVEQQVESLQNAVQAARQLFTSGDLETQIQFANPLPSADESLFDCSFAREERGRDFTRAESAESLERQRG